jgi:plastocyanin
MSKRSFAVLTVATAILVAACGDGGGEPPPDDVETVVKISGDQQQGRVGQLLENPLAVTVTTDGAPAAGVTVNWSTTAAGGTLTPTSVPTDANGLASTSWTLGTISGAQTATATVSGSTGSPATFSATALAASAAVLEEADGNGQTGEINTALAEPVQARVTDEFGNAVADVPVNWTATGAAVSAPAVPSDAAGISQVTVTLGGTAGPITIIAASDGLEGSPVTFTATATEPAAIPTTAAVTVRDNNFLSVRNGTVNPAVDTVAVGGSVTWTWAASTGASHNITPPVPPSPSFTGRETVTPPPLPAPHTATFAVAGTYIYYCSIHGSGASGMSGRIVVR